MRYTSPLGYILSGSAVLVLLAGCSGGGSSSSPLSPADTQPQAASRSDLSKFNLNPSVLRPGIKRIVHTKTGPGFARPDAAIKAASIVSDAGNNTVNVFDPTGVLLAQITGFNQPQGLAAGALNQLYVANTSSSQILVYKDDYKTLLTTLNDPGQFPAGVDADSVTGLVGVTNIIDVNGGPGSVSFYKKGATSPCKTVTSSAFGRIYFGGFDDADNFYVDGQDSFGSTVLGVVKGGCSATSIKVLTASNSISFPGGVRVTSNDTLAIGDQIGVTVFTYNLPSGSSLGSPVATTPLSGASDPVTFGFDKANTNVWTADAGLAASLEYAYPAGGSPVTTIGGLSLPIGVVTKPFAVH